MSVVALAPVMDGRVTNRAERGFVAVEHELMVAHLALELVEVLREAFFIHQ